MRREDRCSISSFLSRKTSAGNGCQPGMFVLFSHHFSCSTAPQAFSRPDRVRSRPTRADDVKAGRAAATEGSAFTSASTTACWMRRVECLASFYCLFGRIDRQVHVDVHGTCDDRISLYPAAPFRLATLLHAWMIAREGWGSSFGRQIGSANLRCGPTATHPTRPTRPKERQNRCALPNHLVRIAPCGTKPCSR